MLGWLQARIRCRVQHDTPLELPVARPCSSCTLPGDPYINHSSDPSHQLMPPVCVAKWVASPNHCRRGRVRRAHVCPDRRSLPQWAAAPARLVSSASVGLPACCLAHAPPSCSGYAMGCWTCLAESVNFGLCSSACPQGGAILGCAGRAGRAARHDCTCCPTHLPACRCSPPTLHPCSRFILVQNQSDCFARCHDNLLPLSSSPGFAPRLRPTAASSGRCALRAAAVRPWRLSLGIWAPYGARCGCAVGPRVSHGTAAGSCWGDSG